MDDRDLFIFYESRTCIHHTCIEDISYFLPRFFSPNFKKELHYNKDFALNFILTIIYCRVPLYAGYIGNGFENINF